MRLLGTHVTLSSDAPNWYAEAFLSGIISCFRHPERIQIQRLTFNGQTVLDVLPEIPVLTQLTAWPAVPDIPEWKKGA